MPKCYLCETQVDKLDTVRWENKNFHPDCAETYKEKRMLSDYICKLFGFKAPGPRVQAQIKKFTVDNHFTYKGIYNSLKYFFEIKGNSVRKANEGIGIVPYVYDEAQLYYKRLERTARALADSVDKNRQRIVKFQGEKPIKKKEEIDLSQLGDD